MVQHRKIFYLQLSSETHILKKKKRICGKQKLFHDRILKIHNIQSIWHQVFKSKHVI